jgi:hypothetical protein
MNPNMKKDQIRSLVERLQFRMKGSAKVPLKQKADFNKPTVTTSLAPTQFKSGGSLPSVVENNKENKSRVKFVEAEDEEDEGLGSDFDANELWTLVTTTTSARMPLESKQLNQPIRHHL